MNKVYEDVDEFLAEIFPSLFNDKKENDETTIQYYIERTSREFSSEIENIINGQNIA
jgi:hypothetical protein